MAELKFEYDPERDVLTIEGNRFSGDFFRFFAPINSGKWFRLVRCGDGEIWITEAQFSNRDDVQDAAAGW